MLELGVLLLQALELLCHLKGVRTRIGTFALKAIGQMLPFSGEWTHRCQALLPRS